MEDDILDSAVFLEDFLEDSITEATINRLSDEITRLRLQVETRDCQIERLQEKIKDLRYYIGWGYKIK